MRICGARELVRTLGTIAQEVGNAELGGDAGSLGQRTAVDQSDQLGAWPRRSRWNVLWTGVTGLSPS